MLSDGLFVRHPGLRTTFVTTDHAAFEHRMVKIRFQKTRPDSALTDFPSENSFVCLLTERQRIVYKHKVAQLVQFQYDRIAVVTLQKPAFAHCGDGGREINITWAEVPTQCRRKPTGNVVLVEVVSRMKHLSGVTAE